MPIRFVLGVPDIEEIAVSNNKNAKLLILDDLMLQCDEKVVNLFTRGSHHRNISVFLVTQNIFNQSKGQRDISLNAQYVILYKNPRDRGQVKFFSRQINDDHHFVIHAYNDATRNPHGYLLFDFKQTTPDIFRLRTCIFPDETHIVYVPRTVSAEDKKYLYQ